MADEYQYTAEEIALLRAAQPSWQRDGLGLFPKFNVSPFPDDGRAVITRSQEAAIVTRKFTEETKITIPDNDVPADEGGCPTSGTISVTLSGVAACGCLLIGGLQSLNATSFAGINGVHTLTWNGTLFAISSVGSITVEHYTDSACTTMDTTNTDSFDITAQCNGGQWEVVVAVPFGSPVIQPGFNGTVFTNAALPLPAGTTIPNNLVCGTGVLVGDGNATVS